MKSPALSFYDECQRVDKKISSGANFFIFEIAFYATFFLVTHVGIHRGLCRGIRVRGS
jgi:hypothetical protein